METLTTKNETQKKGRAVYCRMDKSMLTELANIREQTGINRSELIREGIRRLIEDARLTGINLSV